MFTCKLKPYSQPYDKLSCLYRGLMVFMEEVRVLILRVSQLFMQVLLRLVSMLRANCRRKAK